MVWCAYPLELPRRGLKNELESATLTEPSVFDLLKFYWPYIYNLGIVNCKTAEIPEIINIWYKQMHILFLIVDFLI